MNDIKEIIHNCSNGTEEYIYYTDEEQAIIDQRKQEAEVNKPLTDKERIELLENSILELANLVGGEEMVELYVKRIKEDKMKIEQVPTFWREKVQTELNK